MRTFVTVPEVRADRVTADVATRELRVVVPPNDALLVTVRELRVALLETTSELSVVVPAGTLNPPLETVTLPAVDGLKIILLLAVIWR